jgi:hypothetical protein
MSRRSLVAGGASLVAAPALAMSALPAMAGGPDAALLRRVGLADRYWQAYLRSEADFECLFEAMERHPGFPGRWPEGPAERAAYEAVAARFGIKEAEDRGGRLYDAHEAAAAAAFALPARTLAGAVAKMRLAVSAANEREFGWDHEPCEGLDRALADLERLATR